MSQRFEGHNLEEALSIASEALGVGRWQLTYHVLLEKRGFLGGMKRIVIEAEVNPAAAPPAPAAAIEAMPAEVPRQPRERLRDRPRAARGGERGARNGGGRDRGRRGRRGEERRRPMSETFVGDLPEQSPRSEMAATAVEWIERALSLSRLDMVVRSEENDEQIIVRLYGSDADRMTDRHGELLDAFQVLANKALVGSRVEKEIELDCEQFKERRTEDLEHRAREVADRVRRARREELLPAMSPIERRIVHLALRDDEQVTTESRGEGFYKRVAVILRGEGEAPGTRTNEP